MSGIIGSQIFFNEGAFDLAMWALDEFYKNYDKKRALKIKRIADKMEDKYRENNLYYDRRPAKNINHYISLMGFNYK